MYTYLSQKNFLYSELRADEAKQIFYPYEMSHVVIVLYVQQINMFVYFLIGEPNRKDREFLCCSSRCSTR